VKPNAAMQAERLKRLTVPTAVLGVDLSADESVAFVATFAGVGELNLESGHYRPLYAHDSYASGVGHLPALNQTVSAGYDGQLRWFDLGSGAIVRTIPAAEGWIWDMDVRKRPDQSVLLATASGQYLAGDYEYHPRPSRRPNVQVWDGHSGQLLHQFKLLPPVQAIALSPCGTRVAAANLMGDVGVWDLTVDRAAGEDHPPDWHWQTPDFTAFGVIKSHCQVGGIYAVVFTPDSRQVLVAGMGPMVDPMAGNGKQRWQRFSLEPGHHDQKSQSKDEQVGEGLMEALAMDPRGENFVMAGRLRGGAFNTGLFSVNDGELVHGFKTDSRVTKARFLGDGRTLLLAGALSQSADANHQFGIVDIFGLRAVDE
jgi:hypothetical protein